LSPATQLFRFDEQTRPLSYLILLSTAKYPKIKLEMLSKTFASLLALSLTVLGAGEPNNAISTLYQFPRGSWLENLETGPSNSILATRLDIPAVYQVKAPQAQCGPGAGIASAELIQSFPSATGALGIVEYRKNRFAVITGNYSLETHDSTVGSYAIWDVQFSGAGLDHVAAKKLADIPEAGFPNGMTVMNKRSGTLLIGDSWNGTVYRLDPDTGDYEVVLEDETMKPPTGENLGLNGIHTVLVGHETFLYYTNSLKETLGRVRIDSVSGRATGPYTTLATGVWGDDFTYDRATGDIYVAGNFENIVTKLNRKGDTEGIIGAENQLTVAGATSVLLGGESDRILYVATSGALAAPVNGTITEGAKIVAIRIEQI
jgi:sugar lactone lactonase YvrE